MNLTSSDLFRLTFVLDEYGATLVGFGSAAEMNIGQRPEHLLTFPAGTTAVAECRYPDGLLYLALVGGVWSRVA